ncbi:hypothetical protein M2271_008273 [Streptomyces sp. LBL]|nr:hypothetical protein [Streptomyces sp. LBL]
MPLHWTRSHRGAAGRSAEAVTTQLALDITGTPPAPEQWGVVIDEVLLNSLGTTTSNR